MAEMQNLMEAVNAYSRVNEEKWNQAVDTFEGTGLLEGLSNKGEKGRMATLLENQVKQLIREASTSCFLSMPFPTS